MNVSNVDSVLAQMRAVVAAAQGGSMQAPSAPAATGSVDFANVLKSSLDGVAQAQNSAESMQKANIEFQTTVQVRNKVVAAYNDIMNMQV